MKAPFATPVFLHDSAVPGSADVLVAADHELICYTEGATPEELAFIVEAINTHAAKEG